MKSILNLAMNAVLIPVAFLIFFSGCGSDKHAEEGSGGASGVAGTQSSLDGGAGQGGASRAAGAQHRLDSGVGQDGASSVRGGMGGTAASGGLAGSAGEAGSAGNGGVAGSDVPIDTSSVDLTLDGLNQDLPAPSVNCMERSDFSIGCISVSGVVDGVSFDDFCAEGNTVTADSAHDSPDGRVYGENIACTNDESDWNVRVNTPLDLEFFPQSFVFEKIFLPDTHLFDGVSFDWKNQEVNSASNNFVKTQMAGWNELVTEGPMSWQEREVQGVFAATWSEPDPSACATSQIEGCMEVRLRGTFHAFY